MMTGAEHGSAGVWWTLFVSVWLGCVGCGRIGYQRLDAGGPVDASGSADAAPQDAGTGGDGAFCRTEALLATYPVTVGGGVLGFYDEVTVGLSLPDLGVAIGDETALGNGDVGISDFGATDDPDWDTLVPRFTDAVAERVDTILALNPGGPRVRQGSDDDAVLQAAHVTRLRRDIETLEATQDATMTYYRLEAIWEVWGCP